LHHAMVQGQRASASVAGGVGFEQVELEHGDDCKSGVCGPDLTAWV
jgi:hypothetical protein